MKLIYLKSALKFDSFNVAIGTKIHFFRVLVTIESGRSLLQFVTTNCLIINHKLEKYFYELNKNLILPQLIHAKTTVKIARLFSLIIFKKRNNIHRCP